MRWPLQAYKLAQNVTIVAQDLERHDVLINNLFLQSLAAYELRCYRKAGDLLDHLRTVAKTANISLPKETVDRIWAAKKEVGIRIREMKYGDYDWLSLFRKCMTQGSEQSYLIDAADFIGPVKLDWVPGKGRGLLLTRDVRAGELLIVEKAIGVGFKGEDAIDHRKSYDFMFPRALVPGISTRAEIGLARLVIGSWDNPSLYHQLTQLAGGPKSDTLPSLRLPPSENAWLESELPSSGELDLEQIKNIYKVNAYSLPLIGENLDTEPNKEGGGVFYASSFINHSCIPNTSRIAFGDVLVIRANTDLRKGEEITQNYMIGAPYHLRAIRLKDSWGIDCTCALCRADRIEGHEKLSQRRKLIRYLEWVLGPISSVFGPPLLLLTTTILPTRWAHIPAYPLVFVVKRLVRMVEATFTHSEDRRLKDQHLSAAYSVLAFLAKYDDRLIAIEVRP